MENNNHKPLYILTGNVGNLTLVLLVSENRRFVEITLANIIKNPEDPELEKVITDAGMQKKPGQTLLARPYTFAIIETSNYESFQETEEGMVEITSAKNLKPNEPKATDTGEVVFVVYGEDNIGERQIIKIFRDKKLAERFVDTEKEFTRNMEIVEYRR